jgi:hypothetical protein
VNRPENSETIPFDITPHPDNLAGPHRYSLLENIPGSKFIPALSELMQTEGPWENHLFRGTARNYMMTSQSGCGLSLDFSGAAVSLLRPIDFPVPGPYGPAFTGPISYRIDEGQWNSVSCDTGREVLLASDLVNGSHHLEIKCQGPAPDRWALEGLRIWQRWPAAVSGHIEGGPLLVDIRAEIKGPVAFTRSIRDGRTGQFSVLLPSGGQYQMNLKALGWEPASLSFQLQDGESLQLPPIKLQPISLTQPAAPPPPSADQPLVLLACGHCNTWGTEPAEWLARRTEWICAQGAHALLLANEVNPAYVAGALRNINCPWIITGGNHPQQGFGDWKPDQHRELSIGPARILTTGIDTSPEDWKKLLAGFRPQDKLRIICSYEPFAPPEMLEQAGVRFYVYGHNLVTPPYWTRAGTTFLRKVDADTFYRIELAPPHDINSAITVTRQAFDRSR